MVFKLDMYNSVLKNGLISLLAHLIPVQIAQTANSAQKCASSVSFCKVQFYLLQTD